MREVTMIGLDCATDDANVGAALGKWRGGALSVQRVTLCEQVCGSGGGRRGLARQGR